MNWKKIRDQYQSKVGEDMIVICPPCDRLAGERRVLFFKGEDCSWEFIPEDTPEAMQHEAYRRGHAIKLLMEGRK